MSIVSKGRIYVTQLLQLALTDNHRYHNLSHTLGVLKSARQLMIDAGLPRGDSEILELAALFHDSGFVRQYANHEAASVEIAKTFLQREGYPAHKINRIAACIEATRISRLPATRLQALLKDADLHNLGSTAFFSKLPLLRHEWEVFCKQIYSEEEWLALNLEFLHKHHYHTPEARARYGHQFRKNLQQVEQLLATLQE